MPQTENEILWWAFNLAFLALVYMIKQDTGQTKRDIRETKERQIAADLAMAAGTAACKERHLRLDFEIVGIKEKIK